MMTKLTRVQPAESVTQSAFQTKLKTRSRAKTSASSWSDSNKKQFSVSARLFVLNFLEWSLFLLCHQQSSLTGSGEAEREVSSIVRSPGGAIE